MKTSVYRAELKTMSKTLREQRVDGLVDATRRAPNGEIAELDTIIVEYETKYGCPSADLQARLADGRLTENADVCRWLMLVELRSRLVSRLSP